MSIFADKSLERTRCEIREWLNAPDPRINQIDAENKCMDDTGLWFVDGQIYEQWRFSQGSFLWLYGLAGCGKTVLCSTIIQRTEKFVIQRSSVLAFYYFSFRSDITTKTDSCIRSIIQQLANQSDDLDALNLLRQKSQGGAPRRKELLDTLRGMLTGFEQVFIIIDALDECGDRQELFELLDTLRHWKLDQLRILVTSRDEPDIRNSLNPTPEQQVSLKTSGVDHDIGLFVVKSLEREKNLQQWPELRGLTENALVKGAQGMFRWVDCQIESLRSCLTRAMVKKALKKLPRSLDETYERILRRVDPEHHNYVIRLLQWLCLADGPIEYESLRHALAVSPGESAAEELKYDPEDCFESFEDIISLCPGFLNSCKKPFPRYAPYNRINYEVDALQLAHYSVKEFLASNRFPEAPDPIHKFKINVELANLALIKSCLVYLIHGSRSLYIEAKPIWEIFNYEAEGFLNRAAREWIERYRDAPYDRTSTELAASYLTGNDVYFQATNGNLAIVFAISIKLYTIAKHLIEDCHIDLNFKIKSSPLFEFYGGPTPLHIACSGEGYRPAQARPDFVRLLLENNADVNALNDEQETPLLSVSRHWSAYSLDFTEQHLKIIKLLLRNNAEVNTSAMIGMTPLHWATALSSGGMAVIEILLQYNADITARDKSGETPLLSALSEGNTGVYITDSPGRFLDLLWFKGSQYVQNKHGQNALHLTCMYINEGSRRPQEIINWLVSKEVGLHARDQRGLTPILTAAKRENDVPFQALVPHIKERSGFRGCLEAHLLGTKERSVWSKTQYKELVKLIFTHDPEPFGDIKNNVGVLSRYLVQEYFKPDWSALVELLLEQGLGLEDNMVMGEFRKIIGRAFLNYRPMKFEITMWLSGKLRDEGPGLVTLELCNAVIRMLKPPPNEGSEINLKANDSQNSHGNGCSDSDRQKNSEVDHKNNKRKRLEEEDLSSDEEDGKDETGQVEDDHSGFDRQKDTEVGHDDKKRKMVEASSSDEKEGNNNTGQVQDDNESYRRGEDSEAIYGNEESPQSEGRSFDQKEDTSSTDQVEDDNESDRQQQDSEAGHDNEKSLRSDGESFDQELGTDWTGQAEYGSESNRDETDSEASLFNPPYDSWPSTEDEETIQRLRELRTTLLHQIYE